ncbi:hypothetical protein [Paraburkholderia sp.]|uniref:hypothetical protein n=1 Tax=Paraburkholderia sp. TaxID=1926495 RepID=UPI0025D0B7B3|nr:hypothetical protein [Paraburkholderia sp.]
MIPSFEIYLRKHLFSVFVFILPMTAFFAASITRNILDISLAELIVSLGVMSASLIYALLRDSRGYWFYVMCSVKIFDSKERRKQYMEESVPPILAKFLPYPVRGALLGFVLTALVCIPAYALFQSNIYIFIFLFCLTLQPKLVQFIAKMAAKMQVKRVIESVENPAMHEERSRVRMLEIIGMDLLFTMLINLSLVLPIARKPAFDLQHGYGNPAFIVAFLILMSIVHVLLLLFAGKSRRFAMTGELMLGILDKRFMKLSPSGGAFFKLSKLRRCVCYFMAMTVWSIVLCVGFDVLDVQRNFALIYLVGLAPLMLCYVVERFDVLRRDFLAAQDTHQRLVAIGENQPAIAEL